MNILYVDWNCFGANDVIEAFRSLGHTVTGIELTDACHSGIDWSFVDILGKRMELEKIDVLFSFNFFQHCQRLVISMKENTWHGFTIVRI